MNTRGVVAISCISVFHEEQCNYDLHFPLTWGRANITEAIQQWLQAFGGSIEEVSEAFNQVSPKSKILWLWFLLGSPAGLLFNLVMTTGAAGLSGHRTPPRAALLCCYLFYMLHFHIRFHLKKGFHCFKYMHTYMPSWITKVKIRKHFCNDDIVRLIFMFLELFKRQTVCYSKILYLKDGHYTLES